MIVYLSWSFLGVTMVYYTCVVFAPGTWKPTGVPRFAVMEIILGIPCFKLHVEFNRHTLRRSNIAVQKLWSHLAKKNKSTVHGGCSTANFDYQTPFQLNHWNSLDTWWQLYSKAAHWLRFVVNSTTQPFFPAFIFDTYGKVKLESHFFWGNPWVMKHG